MFEHFTDRARKTMALANQEANRYNHDHIEPEHIMLGLVKESSGVGAKVLKKMGCDFRKVQLEVEQRVSQGQSYNFISKAPCSSSSKKVIKEALVAARELGHNYIGTEHILMGLVRIPNTVAQDILRDAQISADQIKEELMHVLGIGHTELDSFVEDEWNKPSWDEYFMTEATTALSRSPDPSTKHGAIIVNSRNRPVGQGYNGFPSGGDESIYPTIRPDKYVFIIHAEANAILNCTFPPDGCTLYITGVPCNNCMKHIIQAGIKRVVYGKIGSDMVDVQEFNRTMMMADNHGVEIVEYDEAISPYQWHLRIAGYLKRKGWT